MDRPFKVIHKYKNNNKRIQYNVYIFVGNLIKDNIRKILEKIKNVDLYVALTTLDKTEMDELNKQYGESWYESFYNMHHIFFVKNSIVASNVKTSEILKIYGKEWFDAHMHHFKKRTETIQYSYETKIKTERERKEKKKRKIEEEIDEDFTFGSDGMSREEPGQYEQKCEEDDETQYGGDDDEEENIEDIFNVEENVEEIKKTTKELKEALGNSKFSKHSSQIIDFDTSRDNSTNEEHIKNIFRKTYIFNQFIFDDDTVISIKGKICCAVKNNNKYGENTYIIPEYQYLWSEYFFENKIEKIMIGQKWIVRNNILKMNVEPLDNLISYEELRGNLANLKDNIKRYGRIKREDENNTVMSDYSGFYTYNEIYMIDLYNEFGIDYNPTIEDIKNLVDVYLRIYFPHIQPESFSNILKSLRSSKVNDSREKEQIKMKNIHDSISNSLILDNEIFNIVESNKNNKDFGKMFGDNYIIQAIVYLYVFDKNKKIDLRKIFDNFVVDNSFPFIQYKAMSSKSSDMKFDKNFIMKYPEKNVVKKWFENSPIGISLKSKTEINGRWSYITININENGRIDYKIHWREGDAFTSDDIVRTYRFITILINKINSENKLFMEQIKIPDDSQYNYAFINTIQKFTLPKDSFINHDDLSDFSRLFFPYVSLITSPRKREGKKESSKGKFGTYLRYKRVSNYENTTKIENRILYFYRHYEYTDDQLISQISKEFNITEKVAGKIIEHTMQQNPNVKRTKKELRKFENIKKIKLPGIGIEIQGKERDKYKLRIDGARDKNQLKRINDFLKVLIWLYSMVYILKDKEMQKLKVILDNLTNIAKRKHKIDEINDIATEYDKRQIKQVVSADETRLSYVGDNKTKQWSRDCQNFGKDTLRRPTPVLDENELIKQGYKKVKKLGKFDFEHYEKIITIKDDDGKPNEVALKAAKLKALDTSDEKYVYWTCSPETNGKHMYIGFLGKSSLPIPCCFIKDALYSMNEEKRTAYLESMGVNDVQRVKKPGRSEKLYILHENNKVEVGRVSLMSKYIDALFNKMTGSDKKIKNNYLQITNGYFFKYGVEQNELKYMSALAYSLKYSISEIKEKIIKALENDKKLQIFTSLNNGDIRNEFNDVSEYIKYIKDSQELSHTMIRDIICIPGVITKDGVYVVMIKKKTRVIEKQFEKEKIKTEYILAKNNNENTGLIKKTDVIFLLKEDGYYNPIVYIKKEENKEMSIDTSFRYSTGKNNIVNIIYDFFDISSKTGLKLITDSDDMNAKECVKILRSLKETEPKCQIINGRFKCTHIITKTNTIVPVAYSGSIYDLDIVYSITDFVSDFNETRDKLKKIRDITNGKIDVSIRGIQYDSMDGDDYNVIGIFTSNRSTVPVIDTKLSAVYVNDKKFAKIKIHNDNYLNKIISEKNVVEDERTKMMEKKKYIDELYQLFRYHFSYFVNQTTEGKEYYDKIIALNDGPMKKSDRFMKLKGIIYEMTDRRIAEVFNTVIQDKNLKINIKDNHWLSVPPVSNPDEYKNVKINNNRSICNGKENNICELNNFCRYDGKKGCMLSINEEYIYDFINRITNEIYQNGLNACELLKHGNCYVSDVVNNNVYIERKGEYILSGSNVFLDKILVDLFGKDNVPKLSGSKYLIMEDITTKLNESNPLTSCSSKWLCQKIMENDMTIFRAFSNCYYWRYGTNMDRERRNLGYVSELQTKLSNYYRGKTTQWMIQNKDTLNDRMSAYITGDLNKYILKLINNKNTLTNCILELAVLSKMNNVKICVYNEEYVISMIFDSDNYVVYDSNIQNEKMNNPSCDINILISFKGGKSIPTDIRSLYMEDIPVLTERII